MKDEKVLYETNVKYKKRKYDTKISITNNKITLQKKGIFKRKYKINVYNDDVEVKRKHNIVEITTLVIIVDKNKKEIVKMSKTVMSLFKK